MTIKTTRRTFAKQATIASAAATAGRLLASPVQSFDNANEL